MTQNKQSTKNTSILLRLFWTLWCTYRAVMVAPGPFEVVVPFRRFISFLLLSLSSSQIHIGNFCLLFIYSPFLIHLKNCRVHIRLVHISFSIIFKCFQCNMYRAGTVFFFDPFTFSKKWHIFWCHKKSNLWYYGFMAYWQNSKLLTPKQHMEQ